MTRHQLLAVGAGIGAAAALPEFVVYVLRLLDELSSPPLSAWYQAAAGLDILGATAAVAAFGVAVSGFLRASTTSGAKALAISAGLFAVYGLTGAISGLIGLVEAGGARWRVTAYLASGASGGALLLVTGVLVAIAVLRRSNRLLGWGCVGLGAHCGLVAGAYGFYLAVILPYMRQFSPLSFSGGIPAGLRVEIGGWAVTAIAAAIAAVAFFAASARRRRRESWVAQRGRLLMTAAVVFAAGFVIKGIGGMIYAGSDFGWNHVTEDWLQAAWDIGLALAAVCGALAFSRSGRAAELEQRDRPDLAAFADPG